MAKEDKRMSAKREMKDKRTVMQGNNQSLTDSCSTVDSILLEIDAVAPKSYDTNEGTVRRVSFGEVEIRPYFTTIGDNPGSMCGAPVTLSWDFDTEAVRRLQLEEYEERRGPPRSGKALFLDREVREAILLECGFPIQEIIVAANQATLDRLKRRKTVMTLKYAPLHEALEKVKRKVTRIRWIVL
mmetsp:Transcript_16389/g.23391  ORF Transcript_16389/g.23391 Transcript_16389/m.23391 type:complete len:185 (-) Transcript_16389:257-811(-)